MGRFLRASAAVAVGVTAIVAASTAAGADPKGPPTHLMCEGMPPFHVTVAGNGLFTPAHDLESTTVFIPVAFPTFEGMLIDVATGAVVLTVSDPPFTKGSSDPKGRTLGECSYTFTVEFVAGPDDEGLVEGRTYRFVGEGTVIGFASGRR